MKKTMLCLLAALLVAACSEKDDEFKITGKITSAEGKTIHFYAMKLTGIEEIDSVKLDADGTFRFQNSRPSCPEFYCLRIDDQIINLSVDSTETILIQADYPTMGTAYEVHGSKNCLIIKELSNKLVNLQHRVENILNDKTLTLGEQERMAQELVDQYKDEMKKNYILTAPESPSAYFALFQTLGGRLIFDPKTNRDDIRYVGAVATAWDELYQGSDRAENLRNIAIQGMLNTRQPTPVTLDDLADKVTITGFIDIELPDINGNIRQLSDIKDKVILLDFTAYSLPASEARNITLRALYDKYKAQGLSIYQISLDGDEHYWKTACEHLPWICVYDEDGTASDYISSYVVRRLPTFFLIDKNGDLVARDEQIEDVDAKIAELCKQ